MATVTRPPVAAHGSERPAAVRRFLPPLFYGGVGLALVGSLVPFWSDVLPGPLATRIGHNSEAYLFVLVLAAWIQYVRPRLAGSSREVVVTRRS